jgi:hypothetical protein
MSNDTPFLLRMDMIKLAQQRASEKFHSNMNTAYENSRSHNTPVPVIAYPTTEDIVAEAKILKSFVDGN